MNLCGLSIETAAQSRVNFRQIYGRGYQKVGKPILLYWLFPAETVYNALYFELCNNIQKIVVLSFASHDEMDIFLPVFLQPADQFKEFSLIGQPLYHRNIEHIRQASIPDGEDLIFDSFSHH